MNLSEAIFDTRVGAKKIFVTIKTKFVLRKYINKIGMSPIYLFITSPGARERIKTDIELFPKDWSPIDQKVLSTAHNHNLPK